MSGYYPAGLTDNTPGCPWSEPIVPEMDFDVTCSQTLSRTTTVTTNNYVPGEEGTDYETDDEGHPYATSWRDDPDTSDTNWADAYANSGCKTPLELIGILKDVLQNNLKHGIVFRSPYYTKRLIEECEGWCEDETEFIEE